VSRETDCFWCGALANPDIHDRCPSCAGQLPARNRDREERERNGHDGS